MSIDFTPQGYVKILRYARDAGYRLCRIRDAFDTSSPAMIVRHDVDLSLELAVELAELEAAEGVASTFFVMTTNDYYSPFNRSGRAAVRRMHALGHEIGLHWDSSNYDPQPKRALNQFKNELAYLSDAVGAPIVSAAQHIPTDSPLVDVERHIEFEAYAMRFRNRFRYVSDSGMRWRTETPLDLIDRGVEIHFCSHPIWWIADGKSGAEKLRASLRRRVGEMSQLTEEFIAYIENYLENREAFDLAFEARKGRMNCD